MVLGTYPFRYCGPSPFRCAVPAWDRWAFPGLSDAGCLGLLQALLPFAIMVLCCLWAAIAPEGVGLVFLPPDFCCLALSLPSACPSSRQSGILPTGFPVPGRRVLWLVVGHRPRASSGHRVPGSLSLPRLAVPPLFSLAPLASISTSVLGTCPSGHPFQFV